MKLFYVHERNFNFKNKNYIQNNIQLKENTLNHKLIKTLII